MLDLKSLAGAGLVAGALAAGMSGAAAQTVTVTPFYDFTGSTITYPTLYDGATPDSALFHASDGNYYGVTQEGGAHSDGTIYRITPAGVETPIYQFASGSDGQWPDCNLISGNTPGYLYGTSGPNFAQTNGGAVYKVNTSTGALTILHTFPYSINYASPPLTGTPPDGSYPSGGLVLGSDGNYYGTTLNGGASGRGTIFRVNEAGTVETVVYSFVGDYYSTGPITGLTLGANGVIYGASETTGAGDHGQIFSITIGAGDAVTVTILHTFVGSDGNAPCSDLQPGYGGQLYGTTYSGGLHGAGTIYSIYPSGVFTQLYSFKGGATDGEYPIGGLLQAPDGNFYGTTTQGGAFGYGALYSYSQTTGAETMLYSFEDGYTTGNTEEANPEGDLILGADGNLYGTAIWGGGQQQDGDIYKVVIPPYIKSISVSPSTSTVKWGQAFTSTPTALDQHGNPLVPQPFIYWESSGGIASSTTLSGNAISITANTVAGVYTLYAINDAGKPPYAETYGTSTFTIVNPVPTATSISPTSAVKGAASTTLTVHGTGYATNATVYWNGTALATTYVSATQLTATIPAADLTAVGTFNVTVSDPAPGGGTSNKETFQVVL